MHAFKLVLPAFVCIVWAAIRLDTTRPESVQWLTVIGLLVLSVAFVVSVMARR